LETGCRPGGRGETLAWDKPGEEDGVMVSDRCTGGEAVTVILAGGELAMVTSLEWAGVMWAAGGAEVGTGPMCAGRGISTPLPPAVMTEG